MWLNFPNPVAVADGKEVEAKKVKQAIYKAHQQEIQSTVSEERWQGKLIKNRWDYVHRDNQTQPTFKMTPGLKPFTLLNQNRQNTRIR